MRGAGPGAGRLLSVLAVLSMLQISAHAGEDPRAPRSEDSPGLGIREPARATPNTSLDRIIEQIKRRYQATVVRVDHAKLNGRAIYVLRLLFDDGEVRHVRVDAETGREIP